MGACDRWRTGGCDDDALRAGVWLNPNKPEKPAPPRVAVGQFMVVAASTDTGAASGYFFNTVTGQQFLGMPPLPRNLPTKQI
jgi:hypothetical protein